jgi:hypothetical protein
MAGEHRAGAGGRGDRRVDWLMTDRRCGHCRYYIPEDKLPENMIERGRYKAKHQFPTCQGDGKRRDAEDKPCLIWTERKGEGGR